MAGTFTLFDRPRPDDFVERRGGMVVALCVAMSAWVSLAMTIIDPVERTITQPPLRLILEPVAQPAPPPEPVEPMMPEPDLAATSVNPNPDVEIAMAAMGSLVAPTQDEVLPDSSLPARAADWSPRNDADLARLASLRSQVRNFEDRLERQQIDVTKEVNRLAVESAGREFLLNSDGGRTGAIRTFDNTGIPRHIETTVLARYGIEVTPGRYVQPQVNQWSFLTAATTTEGTFVNQAAAGYYDVFTLSAKAFAMMSAMELEEMYNRGYDPARTRVRKTVFGIIKNANDDWDIGVIELEVEDLR